jgi:ribosomal protein L11 methyltransferase
VLRSAQVFPPGHPTTRLCLDLLREYVEAEGPAAPVRVLDLGCGSGVLLLAAAALGLKPGLGVDLSRRAVLVSRDNARANGLAGVVHLVQGSSHCLRGTFDLILANLPLTVQLELVAELVRLAGPRGRLSGCGEAPTDAADPAA